MHTRTPATGKIERSDTAVVSEWLPKCCRLEGVSETWSVTTKRVSTLKLEKKNSDD